MMVQKWVVRLQKSGPTEKWIGYDDIGTIYNAAFHNAIRYDSQLQAERALKIARRYRRWPEAEIFGTLEDDSE